MTANDGESADAETAPRWRWRRVNKRDRKGEASTGHRAMVGYVPAAGCYVVYLAPPGTDDFEGVGRAADLAAGQALAVSLVAPPVAG